MLPADEWPGLREGVEVLAGGGAPGVQHERAGQPQTGEHLGRCRDGVEERRVDPVGHDDRVADSQQVMCLAGRELRHANHGGRSPQLGRSRPDRSRLVGEPPGDDIVQCDDLERSRGQFEAGSVDHGVAWVGESTDGSPTALPCPGQPPHRQPSGPRQG